MIQIDFDQARLEELAKEALAERMKEIENDVFFMDSKQLQKFVGMSWNSITFHLLSDPTFPKLRLGSKWLFPRQEVESYMHKYYAAVRDGGGDIKKYVAR